jgi:predicted dehydrogenase
MRETFDTFCVVGFGSHARTKIAPAIRANGGKLAAIVTSKHVETSGAEKTFTSIDAALAALPRTVTFFLSTPPALHYDQVCKIAEAGHDIFVEKPAFITTAEVRGARNCISVSETLFVEAFMHCHTELFHRFQRFWATHADAVKRLSIRFLIPEIPENTYRSGSSLAATTLYDIGCYAISLLCDLQLNASPLTLENVLHAGEPLHEQLLITGTAGQIELSIMAGKGEVYENVVDVMLEGGDRYQFSPFFFGRPGQRIIECDVGGRHYLENVVEKDAFQAMLAQPRSEVLRRQGAIWDRLLQTTASLEALGRALVDRRERAGGA